MEHENRAARVPDDTARRTIDACAEVHRRLGPGLETATYAEALAHELTARALAFQQRVRLPVFYRGVRLAAAYELDACVERSIAVILRVVPALLPVHRAELRTLLRASGLGMGLVVNFRAARFAEGLVFLKRSARSLPAPRDALGDVLDGPTVVRPPHAEVA